MQKSSTFILRSAIIVLGLIILSICVFAIPPIIFSGFTGPYLPILIGLYIPALPYFFALYQAMKIVSYIDNNQAFSNNTLHALTRIKYAAIIISVIFGAAMPYIYYAAQVDDAPGVIVIGLVITFASATIATAAGVLQRLVQSALDIKSENDLTV